MRLEGALVATSKPPANPQFSNRLLKMGDRLEERFRIRVNIHVETALSTQSGSADLGIDSLHGTSIIYSYGINSNMITTCDAKL